MALAAAARKSKLSLAAVAPWIPPMRRRKNGAPVAAVRPLRRQLLRWDGTPLIEVDSPLFALFRGASLTAVVFLEARGRVTERAVKLPACARPWCGAA